MKSNRKTRNRINKIKELKELETTTTKKELEELEIEKINKAIAIIPKEIVLPYLLKYVCQLIKQAKEKEVSEKFIRITETLKDVVMKKK